MEKNPFLIGSKKIEENFMDWERMYPESYDKNTASPWTKVRVILMNGTEFASSLFLHEFARHTDNNDLRRDLALVRRQEQQQQKRISVLKPIDESILEQTISYEQLAVELTAILAQNEDDINNKNALDFALLEDFDHLYRFSNMLKKDLEMDASGLVGGYTEVMPGRPTIAEHRHPYDSIKKSLCNTSASDYSKLVANIITAAEQQTMNFYMNVAQMYKTDLGRRLYQEIAMIEEQHVSQYESLKDPNASWLECWVMHEYTECYLYYSMMMQETDEKIRSIWEEHFFIEVSHLKLALEYLKKIENRDVKDLFKNPEFPDLLFFGANKEYIRQVIEESIEYTASLEDYVKVGNLGKNSRFAYYQDIVNNNDEVVASHSIIEDSIKRFGMDIRYQDKPYPIDDLKNRTVDNKDFGRVN